MLQRILTIIIILFMTSAACTPAAAPAAVQASPTVPPTESPLPTQTQAPTSSPTMTALPSPTETFTPEPTVTYTFVPLLPPSSTSRPEKRKPPARPSATGTTTSTPEPSATFTATLCHLPTPEPLWVEPVTSPTDQLSQVITVYVGNGTEVTVSTESGTFTVTGSFGAYANPALVEITLLPDTTHHLAVSAKIQPPPNNCNYDGYTLDTTQDRNGAPLVIIQNTPVQ